MCLNIIYKVQYLDKTSGFWTTISNHEQGLYHEAVTGLFNEYKFNNSRQYRLIQVKEEQLQILYPPSVNPINA